MFRAYDSGRERLVAVKLFKLDLPPERGHQLVAEFEQLIAADLTHPAIAAPLATGISGVSAYLAHEYVAAESLDLAVREYGPAPTADVLRVAAQLAGALDFAAAVHVTQGALHPRDVLLSSDDTRVTGLGVTRALERIGVVAPVRRPYTAPERIAGGEWDRRADVFSLAALMHELIWGRRISGLGAQAAESLTAVAGADLPALRDVFARALAENPASRYETALGFAEALTEACPNIGVAPAPAPTSKRRATRGAEPRLPLEREPDLAVVKVIAAAQPQPEPELIVHATAEPVAFAPPDLDITPTPIAEPEIVLLDHTSPDSPATTPAGLITGHDPDVLSALERTRSAVWPLVLALGVGIAIGFAGGFFTGSRERHTPGVESSELRTQNLEVKTQNLEVKTESSQPKAQSPEPQNLKSEISNLKSQGTTGRLLVRSTPAGAIVSVDGKSYGRTPATVTDLAPGAHRVRITRDGYTPEERRFAITASRPASSMIVPLARLRTAPSARAPQLPVAKAQAERFAGRLAVDSRPTGAKVFMDGQLVGTTPMALPAVPAGSHAIRLEHDGYRRWSSSVRVVASEQNRVTASLER